MSSSISKVLTLTAGVAMALGATAGARAQSAPLSAEDSDPRVMGWMQGFPPPEDKIITQPDSVYFSFPKLRWSVCHLREFLPTEEISRGTGRAGSPDLPLAGRVCRASGADRRDHLHAAEQRPDDDLGRVALSPTTPTAC